MGRKVETPDVRVGDVWADNDKRSYGRKLRVLEVNETRVLVVTIDRYGREAGRKRWIARKRMRPTSNGYRLVRRTDREDG